MKTLQRPESTRRMSPSPGPRAKDTLAFGIVFILCASQFFNGAANACYYSFIPVWMAFHGFTIEQIGYVQGLTHLSIFCFVPVFCLLIDFMSNSNRLKKQSLFSFWCIYGGISRLSFIYWEQSWNPIFCGFVILTVAVQESTNSAMDSIILSIIPDPNQYGRYRLWSAVGWGSVAFALGLMFDRGMDIDVMFYFYCAFMGCLGWIWLIYTVKIKMTQHDYTPIPSTDLVSTELVDEIEGEIVHESMDRATVHNMSILQKCCVFLNQMNLFKLQIVFSIFLFGMCYGVISTFLFLRLLELGASNLLMGITMLISIASEIPTLWFMDRVLDYIGNLGIINLILMTYMFRFAWYGLLGFGGLMLNPWYVLPAEILHGFTYSCVKVLIAVFAHRLATDVADNISDRGYSHRENSKIDLSAFSQGLLNAMFNGFGQGAGALLGGAVYTIYGPHYLFFGSALGLLPFFSLYVVQFVVCKRQSGATGHGTDTK